MKRTREKNPREMRKRRRQKRRERERKTNLLCLQTRGTNFLYLLGTLTQCLSARGRTIFQYRPVKAKRRIKQRRKSMKMTTTTSKLSQSALPTKKGHSLTATLPLTKRSPSLRAALPLPSTGRLLKAAPPLPSTQGRSM